MTDQEWEDAEREKTRNAIAKTIGAVYWPEAKCYAVYHDDDATYYDLDMNKLNYDPFNWREQP
jgi:hypothetical protein